MQERVVQLIFGAALHDFGKVVQRAEGQRVKHSLLGAEALKPFFDDPAILNQLKYHHANELKAAKLSENDLTYITYVADNVASGIDRRTIDGIEKSTYRQWDTYQPLQDIFNQFTLKPDHSITKRYYLPHLLDDRKEINHAQDQPINFTKGDYAESYQRIKEGLKHIRVESDYVNSLLNLLEACLTYVPSSTNLEEVADISLYDHSKITAAIASCLYYYLTDQGGESFKQQIFGREDAFYQLPAYRLMKFDISGIQSFIYTIRDQKASKMLRSRSFYLEMLAENIIDEILERAELSRANLLYSGGGNAYLLLPNTSNMLEIIDQVDADLNTFLRKSFGDQLYVAFASVACSSQILNPKDQNSQGYGQLYADISQAISRKKLARYTGQEIKELNEWGKQAGRECPICHRVHNYSGANVQAENRCDICQGLVDFSQYVYKSDFFEISHQESLLPVGFGKYLHPIKVHDIKEQDQSRRLYAKNKFYTGLYQSSYLWVGDYNQGLTFADYAGKGELDTVGIDRLGVLRCDVDDLGSAFISGFKGKYNTLSRSATFSRAMSLFFQFHINYLLEKEGVKGALIYSGGDDVFLVGAWYDLLHFAITLRQEFIHYTNGKLTLSAGLGLFNNKTPVPILAKQTGDLEDAAKSRKGDEWQILKDGIALFDENFVFSWDDFINRVYSEKFKEIQNFFQISALSPEYGKSFIYKLLDLIRQRDQEAMEIGSNHLTISSARWVYFTSRMEPRGDEKKQIYQQFIERLYNYFQSDSDRHQLECALMIYLYTVRDSQDNEEERHDTH